MKIVLWRLAHDCLPTGLQLLRRRVPALGNCPFCCRPESIEHCLLFCQYARAVWEEIKLSFHIKLRRSEFRSPKQWLFDFLSRSTDRCATVMTVTIWHIWEARNCARNSGEVAHPRRTAAKVKAYVDMILLHLYKPASGQRHETPASSTS